MSFLRVFNGDAGNSTIFNGNSGITFKKIYVSGFDSNPDANGEYVANGELCNCAPLFKNASNSKNLTFSNSENFFNLNDFYILNSFSENNNKSDFSVDSAAPDNLQIKKDSMFNGSDYLSFNINTNLNNASLPNYSYLGILFDDPVNNNTPNYINHNIEDSLVNLSLSFSFDESNQINNLNGFTLGVIIRQYNSYYIFDLGKSGNDINEKNISLSKNIKANYFNKISGTGNSKPNISGSSPYEIGIFVGDSRAGDRKGKISNLSLNFYGVSPRSYYIYREDVNTVLSDSPCSTSGLSNFIYSSNSIDSGSILFDGKRGASALYGNETGLGVTSVQNTVATVTKKSHSDLDGTYDYLDPYPFNKDSANISIFRYSNISGIHPSLSKITFSVEGFNYIYEGSENSAQNVNDICAYISNLVNAETNKTGIYSQADDSIDQLLFWRPKGGDYVKFSMTLEYRGQTTTINWEFPDSNIDYTDPPTNPLAPPEPEPPFDPFA